MTRLNRLRSRGLVVLAGMLLGSAIAHAMLPGAATSSNSASATSRTPDEPIGTQPGDLLIGVCSTVAVTDGTWTVPTGWTKVAEVSDTGGTDRDVVLAYGVRGESAATLTFSYSGSAAVMRCTVAAVRGVDTSNPLDVTYSGEDHHVSYADGPNAEAMPITTVSDGAWVVLVQVRVGDVAESTEAPSGYTELADFFGANPETSIAYKEVATAGTETPGTWGHTGADFADTTIFTLALRPAPVVPEFTSGPSIAATTNGYTISGTITGSGTLTVHAVACLPAAANASAAQIKAGDCAGDVAAEIAASDVWSTGVADSFALAKAGALIRHKVCVVASDGANDTDVTCSTANRSADAGQTIVTLASVSGTSPFAVQSDSTGDTTEDSAEITGMTSTSFLQPGMRVNVSAGFDCAPCVVEAVTPTSVTLEEPASSTQSNVTVSVEQHYDPAVAAADLIEHDQETSHGDPVTWGTDGNLSYSDTSGGQHTTIGYCIQDVSGAGSFTVPACWNQDDTLHFFSTRPAFGPDFGVTPVLFYEGVPAALQLPCDDVDGQTVTVTSRSSPPSGLSIVSNVLSGTPDTENEAGEILTLDCADDGFLYATPKHLELYVTDDVITVVDFTGMTIEQAREAAETMRPWLIADLKLEVSFACSEAANGEVFDQSPAAASTVDAENDVISLTVSTGPCGGLLLRRRR